MSVRRVFVGFAVIASMSLIARAADAPPAAGSDTKNVRLIKPYSELKDLTPEQTEKLKQIHKRFLEEMKALEAKQQEQLMSVLSDQQKREVADIELAEKTGKKTSKKAPAAAGGAGAANNAPQNPNGASRDPEAK